MKIQILFVVCERLDSKKKQNGVETKKKKKKNAWELDMIVLSISVRLAHPAVGYSVSVWLTRKLYRVVRHQPSGRASFSSRIAVL